MRSKKIVLMLLLLSVFLFSDQVFPGNEACIETEGRSEISFDNAFKNARRAAIERSMISVLSSGADNGYDVNKYENLLNKDDYFKSCTILDKSAVDGNYITRIRADIDCDQLKKDIVFQNYGKPRLMVLIAENHAGIDLGNIKLAESEIIRLLENKGFNLLDKQQLSEVKQEEAVKMAFEGNFKATKILGLQYDAQYIIVGEAAVKSSGETIVGSGFKSIEAVLQLKILHASSGNIIGSTTRQAVSANINELTGATNALKEAAGEAANQYIEPKILSSYMDYNQNGAPIAVNIIGVDNFDQYKKIISAFEKIENVSLNEKREWNQSSGLLNLDLIFKGTVYALADIIDSQQLGHSKFYIEDITSEKLTIRYRD